MLFGVKAVAKMITLILDASNGELCTILNAKLTSIMLLAVSVHLIAHQELLILEFHAKKIHMEEESDGLLDAEMELK